RPPLSILLPYTTLFRSVVLGLGLVDARVLGITVHGVALLLGHLVGGVVLFFLGVTARLGAGLRGFAIGLGGVALGLGLFLAHVLDRKSTRLNSSHVKIS